MSKQSRALKLLEQGLQHHRAGNLIAAEQAYVSATALDPHNPDPLNLHGVVALSQNRGAEAVGLFRKAATLQPENPGLWGNLGNALFETGDFAGSETAFRRALRLVPGNPDFSIGIANAMAAAGQADAARELLHGVVTHRPDHASAWFGLARIAENSGQTDQALEWYQRALQANPKYGLAHLNLGAVLQSRHRLDEAEQCYRQALLSGAPREKAYVNLAAVLIHLGKFTDSEQVALAGIRELPQSAELHRQLCTARAHQGRLLAALKPAQQAAALEPDHAAGQMALGGLLFECAFPAEGIATLENLRQASPGDQHIAYVVGVMHLTAGNFHEGWRNLIRRKGGPTRPWISDRLPPELHGVTVGLLREQGLGDELFFLRFVPWLKSLGARVIYQTNPKLVSMLGRVGEIDQLVADESAAKNSAEPAPIPDAAVNLMIGDLPHALYRHCRPEQCDLPARSASTPPPLALTPQPDRVAAVRAQLLRLGPPPYLALTWRGGIAPHEQKGKWWTLFKNIGLEAFGRMLNGLPFTLLAIQRKPLPEEIAVLAQAAGAPIHDLCDINDDLEQMLALLAVIDEYAGVSNTNMHLRAGLQRSARVLVPRPSEWRWMAYGDSSPWFPGFHVYRQELDGDWQSALDNMRTHLLNTSRSV